MRLFKTIFIVCIGLAGLPTLLPQTGIARIQSEPVLPIPESVKVDEQLVTYGKKLFEDPRLSRNGTLSCATCHDLARGGINPADVPKSRKDAYNTPTIFNIAFHFRFFWDGRTDSLEEQAALTITSPTVYNMTWPEVIDRVKHDPDYQRLASYLSPGKQLEPSMITRAIASYERSLITPHAPFDKFLRGNASAISDEAKLGYQRFKDFGCSSCHQGMLLGGNSFQKFGVFSDDSPDKKFSKRDYGRYNTTDRDEDKFVFKVPSLRNVALTAPYFHDGSATTLEQAVSYMGRHQLRRHLSRDEVDSLVAFLKSLTGEWQEKIPK